MTRLVRLSVALDTFRHVARGVERDLPGSWSVLPCMPRSWTPGGSPRLAPRGVSMLPSAVLKASAPPANPLSGLNHAACTIAVYASQPGSPQLHARLASDWRPTFVGQDSHLQDCSEGFRSGYVTSSSFSRLLLAQEHPGSAAAPM